MGARAGLGLPYYPGRTACPFVGINAQALPFGDAVFDTVVAMYTLCMVSQPDHGLRRIRRIPKADGRLNLIEPVRIPRQRLPRSKTASGHSVAVSQMGAS